MLSKQTAEALLEQAPPPDRRSSGRHDATGIVLVRPAEPGGELAQAARLLNLSRGGLSLLLRQPYAAGTRLAVAPLGWERPAPGPVQVVHARPEREYWILGCKFPTRLGHAELRQWLRYHARR
jgi:hypothetical protein